MKQCFAALTRLASVLIPLAPQLKWPRRVTKTLQCNSIGCYSTVSGCTARDGAFEDAGED